MMAAVGFTPIQLFRSTTGGAVPLTANLAPGELAINIANTDMALFAENASGTVVSLMNNPAGLKYPTADGTNGQVVTTNGSGTLTFTSPASGLAVGSTSITGGTSGYALFNNAGTLGNTNTLTSFTLSAVTINDGYTEETVTANTTTTYTISLANGTLQILTLTGNCTFTFPTATTGQSFMMFLKQDATGSRTVTWPAVVKWPSSTAPTITATASKGDKFVFTADGTNWLGSVAGQNYL
jgi:hypothetical protein